MKEVALLTGFGADEFAIWDLKLPYLLGDEIAAIFGRSS
jgi:hypothetical protein